MTRVLVIGGYGTFGIRLVRLLSDVEGLTVFVGGRSAERARAAIADIDGPAALVPTELDRNDPATFPVADIVVDVAGPFQAYADAPLAVLEHCASVGAAYIDLSDDPEFCQLINDHSDRPVTVATGWSTYSAVTGAAVHALGGGPSRAGIVPSPKLPMGRAVIESVLSYAGRDIGGGYGLTRTLRRTVHPPGARPMRSLLFSNVATPDRVLLHPDSEGFVAPQPEVLHRLLIFLSRLAKWRLLPPLRMFAGLIHRVQAVVRVGEPRGGLFVEASGKRFDLIGDGDTGPYVPVSPAAALITAIHAGERFPPGLLWPGGDFPLSRLTPIWDRLGIDHGVRDDTGPLYHRTLGGAMERLPAAIGDLHRGGVFEGPATVERGRNPLGRMVANLLGLPKAGQHGVRVSITTDGRGCERWSRTYGTREMFSTQEAGRGRRAGLIIERFGLFAVHLSVRVEGDRLRYQSEGWSFLNIPLPRRLAPGGDVYELVDEEGRFHFHVDMHAPGFGRLVRYQGWLARVEQEAG